MRWCGVLLALLPLAVSCTQKQADPRSEQSARVWKPVGNPAAQAAQPAPPAAAPVSDGPTIPKGARYTIYCATLTGQGHVLRAKSYKEQLASTTGLKDWYVLHKDTESTLYYGFYKARSDSEDRREAQRLRDDVKRLAGLTDPTTRQSLFRGGCLPVELDTPDPSSPPEWDLRNAKGLWSVQIAAYVDSPLRKQYAVEAVREARAHGVEAYYYHGPSVSSVCVGAWPREAIKEQEAAEASTRDPDQPIVVGDGRVPLPDRLVTKDGREARIMEPKVEIADPTLLQALKDYPWHAVNGEETVYRKRHPRTGQIVEVRDRSMIVQIPGVEGQMPPGEQTVESPYVTPGNEGTGRTGRPTQPGMGRLRSLGE